VEEYFWFTKAYQSNQKPTHRKDPNKSGFPPGSIGDVSSRIGYDVRELLMAGFTHSKISTFSLEEMLGVLEGKYTIKELRKRKSKGN
jgi:hypothetical protein